MTENEMKAVSQYATDQLYNWLTRPENEARTQVYLDQGAEGVLAGGIRLIASSRLPEGLTPNLSQTLLSVTANRFSVNFGEDAPDETYPYETWAGYAAFWLGLQVDYFALADRLLRRFVPEYVPGESPEFLEEDDEADA